MRKILTIVICNIVLCYNSTKAQPYESVFGKDTTQWNIVYQIPDYFPTLIFKAYGDTMINLQKYVPVYMGYHNTPLELYGYFKEDIDHGRLWFRNLEEHEELLMDLSLAKSDSFYFGLKEPKLYTVDTVYYSSEKKYISFNEAQKSYPIRFIEGLGPFNLFFSERVEFPEYAQIRCKKKDNVLVFMNDKYSTCFDSITSAECFREKGFRIFPNPASGSTIRFEWKTGEIETVEIFNLLGEPISLITVSGKTFVDYSTNKMQPGIYLYKATDKNKFYQTGRFVVE